MKIPVAISTDENYLVPSYVMLHSLMNNSNEEDMYIIYVLVEKDFLDESEKLLYSLKDNFNNMEIIFVNMKDAFADSIMQIKHTTIPSMYRLLLPNLLSEFDKCIYVDVDTIVCDDFSKIFSTELGDRYIGAVRDIEAEEWIKRFDYGEDKPDSKNYVNSGLLLMNLRLMRNDNIVSEFLRYSKSKLLFMDQDIVNIVCKGKILFLPLKCNVLVKYRFVNYKVSEYRTNILEYFSPKEIEESFTHPILVHYAQPIKPWKNKYTNRGEVWNKYVKNEIDKDIFVKYIRPFMKQNEDSKKNLIIGFYKNILKKLGIYSILLRLFGKM